jgi:hypothetical protein
MSPRSPGIRYQRDGHRYIVWYGEDRIGFVARKRNGAGLPWNAVDTTMSWSRHYRTRAKAAVALVTRFKRLHAAWNRIGFAK